MHRVLMFELKLEKRRLGYMEVMTPTRLLVLPVLPSPNSLMPAPRLLLKKNHVKEEKRSRHLRALPILSLLPKIKILLKLLPGVRLLFRSPRLLRFGNGSHRCRSADPRLACRCRRMMQWRLRAV